MLAAHDDFLDYSELLKVDESKRLFDSGGFVDTFDGSDDFTERREVLQSMLIIILTIKMIAKS